MSSQPHLRFPEFSFSSPLAAHAIALERHRSGLAALAEHQPILVELGYLRRFMSSLTSARIEGNRTTVLDVVLESSAASAEDRSLREDVNEIVNLEQAAAFIDEVLQPGDPLTHSLVRELHAMAVSGLNDEGDPTPGSYRNHEVSIAGSTHEPPLASTVHPLMDDLLGFANEDSEPHTQLVRMAVAHHRFVWIHPFHNGNGRTARLFSYAMLRTMGFAPSGEFHSLNPTAVFGADRDAYYAKLAAADSYGNSSMVEWCTYVLDGLRRDMDALLSLAQDGAITTIITRAARQARTEGVMTAATENAISIASDGHSHKAGDFAIAFPGTPATRSREISKLVSAKILRPTAPGKRSYRLQLSPNILTPFLFRELDRVGFLPTLARDA